MHIVSLLFHDVYASDPSESGFRSQAADRYKLAIREFDAQLDGLADAGVDPPTLASALMTSTVGDTRIPTPGSRLPSLITVDDGGESYHTAIADRLEALGWRAHCFVTTDVIGQRGFLTAGQIRDLDGRGHVIGSHSASHPARFSALCPSDMRREWSTSRAALEDLLGHAVTVASIPGGSLSPAVVRAAADAGMRVLFTSEPTTRVSSRGDCAVIGRFTIRRGHAPDMAKRFVLEPRWARYRAWMGWNAKAVVKPLLGASYARVADSLLAIKTGVHHG